MKKYTDNQGVGYAYPKAMVDGEWLYVGYSQNKEDVMYTRVPLSSLMLKSSIDDVVLSQQNQLHASGDVYNLQGQKLLISGKYKGIVLRNGKKYLIK